MLEEVFLGMGKIAAALARRFSSIVLVVCAPMATGSLPSASATTASATWTRSSKVMVEKSPAAPPASRVPYFSVMPLSIRNRTLRRVAARSTARSGSRNMVGIVI
jgi:hypothetical protein